MDGLNLRSTRGYLLAAAAGAIGGGMAVALATRAVPRMASRMMAETMGHMAAEAGMEGCDPAQM